MEVEAKELANLPQVSVASIILFFMLAWQNFFLAVTCLPLLIHPFLLGIDSPLPSPLHHKCASGELYLM